MKHSNNEPKKEQVFRWMKLIHIAITLAAFFAAWLIFRYGGTGKINHHVKGFRYNYIALALFLYLYLFFARTYNAYLLGYSRIRDLASAQFISQAFATVLLYLGTAAAWAQVKSPLVFVALLAVLLCFDMLWAYYANQLYYKHNPPKKTIILYRNASDLKRLKTLHGKPTEKLFDVEEIYCCAEEKFSDLKDKLAGYEAIFVSGVDSRCRNGIIKYCSEYGIDGYFLPHVGDAIMRGAAHIQSFTAPVLYSSRKQLAPVYRFVKRGFDIDASLCGIIVLSPIMAVTAIAIKAYDHGPAIYQQTRLTKDAKEFEIYKFRSMRVDVEKDGRARLSAGENDPRITPIGRVVRKCRLDELPQLFNILKGDMSVVGPRPERPEIAEEYYKTLPDFKLRLQVQAGLTGYAQVYGKYNTEPYEKLEFDLLYINRMSVLTDLRLMFATFGILFKSESTKGFEEEMMIPGDAD